MADARTNTLNRIVILRWRSGLNSAEIAAGTSLTEPEVLYIVWAERAERRRKMRQAAYAKSWA